MAGKPAFAAAPVGKRARRRVWPLAAALSALGVCAPDLRAQAPAASPFRSETALVVLQVSVVDERRRFVADLQQQDFAVFEEGAPQDVALFASAAAPLDLMLLLDASGSMQEHMPVVRNAAVNFVRSLRPGDRASVVKFNDVVRVAEPLTGDAAALEAAIRGIVPRGNTALYDALYISLRELARARAGEEQLRRQAIVVLSDGDDTSSRMAYDTVLDEARSGAVTMFTIKPTLTLSGLASVRLTGASVELRQLAEETGGRAFTPARIQDLEGVYDDIAEELGQQYWLAYAPAPSAPGFRRISVKVVPRPTLRARTRSGYYASCRNGIEKRFACR
jgi:Ca-activated chloride channel homolog